MEFQTLFKNQMVFLGNEAFKYLGGAEGRDFRDIKHYRRRKRWLS